MDDIITLRKLGYGFIPDFLQDWYKQREAETYNYKHPSLNQSKKEFFNNDVLKYVYDHDSIHQAIKHLKFPAYELMKVDKAEVKCSREKFESLSFSEKLLTVIEEAYVLALERHQIPNDFKPDPRKSFEIALMKVCTSISSGWWREWAWENYYNVMTAYDKVPPLYDYVSRFKIGLWNGTVKPFTS